MAYAFRNETNIAFTAAVKYIKSNLNPCILFCTVLYLNDEPQLTRCCLTVQPYVTSNIIPLQCGFMHIELVVKCMINGGKGIINLKRIEEEMVTVWMSPHAT